MSEAKPETGPARNRSDAAVPAKPEPDASPQKEIGGRKGPEPTRYGDWERNGIISDF